MISSVLKAIISSGISSQVSSRGASDVTSIATGPSLDVGPEVSAFWSLFEGSSPGGVAEAIVIGNEGTNAYASRP